MLTDYGIEADDDTLILQRQIAASGRSTARINGVTVTIGQLNQISSQLIDIHGQSDHLKLLRPTEQINALDRYAGTIQLRTELGSMVHALHQVESQRARIRGGERERAQRADLLNYQIDEISGAQLEPGEDDQVERDREVLLNIDRLRSESIVALSALDSDESGARSASDALGSALQAIQHITDIDASQASLLERATELSVLAGELASDLRRYHESIDLDASRLTTLDDRLDTIRSLKRKYGATIADVLEFAAQAQMELESIVSGAENDEALAAQERLLVNQITPLAGMLTQERTRAARKLEQRISTIIADLGLGSANVHVHIEPLPATTESGADRIEFLFSPNAGEPPKPLARIASGGETARLMLALKSVLAEGDHTPTLVFDEIDVGVGARSGQAVGEKLWQLGRTHQVIAISHLAQIAAFAESHHMIRKQVVSGRTESRVIHLVGERRRDELAEMIDGKPVSAESRAAADQLLTRIDTLKGQMSTGAATGRV